MCSARSARLGLRWYPARVWASHRSGQRFVVGFPAIQSSQMPIRGFVGRRPGNVTVVLTDNSGVARDVGNGTLNVVVIKL